MIKAIRNNKAIYKALAKFCMVSIGSVFMVLLVNLFIYPIYPWISLGNKISVACLVGCLFGAIGVVRYIIPLDGHGTDN